MKRRGGEREIERGKEGRREGECVYDVSAVRTVILVQCVVLP